MPFRHYRTVSGVVTKYYYANGKRIAERNGSNVYYYHSDHLGSSNIVTDSTGAEVKATLFYPFGATRAETGSKTLAHKFTGQEFDPGTGLYYYSARYYDTRLMRFVSADTLVQDVTDPQSFNRYSYVRNNPVTNTDPSGHAVYITGHPILYAGGHTAVRIVPDDQSNLSKKGNYLYGTNSTDAVTFGKFYTTLSAGPTLSMGNFGPQINLTSTQNRSTDAPGNNYILDVMLPPVGSSDQGLINSLEVAANNFSYTVSGKWEYSLYGGGFNSNSYVSGINDFVGGMIAGSYDDHYYANFDNPLPSILFENDNLCR